jgi:replicative DNA helicase
VLKSVAPPSELLDQAAARLAEIAQRGFRDPHTMEQAFRKAAHRIDDRSAAGYRSEAIMTGLVDVDEKLGGLQPGELIVVAGRTSEGKTAIALNFAYTVTTEADPPVPTLLFSLEQSVVELGDKLIARHCGINSHKLRRPTLLEPQEQQAIIDALEFSKGKPLFIVDEPQESTLRIIAATRRMKASHGIRLVIVDYLQLLMPDNPRDPRYEQVAAMTRGLKMLAREVSIPVVVLCQLNREADKVEPRLSHLRESGNIEQDADTVLLISKPDADDAPENALRINIAKNRGGPTGKLFVAFDKATGRIGNLVHDVPFVAGGEQ